MDVKLNSIMASIIVLVLSVLVVKVLNRVWLRPKKVEKFLRMQGMQGNSYRFPFGDLKDFLACNKTEQPKTMEFSDDLPSHILPYYHHIIRKYGEASFIWSGPTPGVNIVDPEIIKEILANNRIFHKLPPETVGRKYLKGVLILEDENWEMQRRRINPAFHVDKVKKMIPTMYLSCCNTLEKWETLFSKIQFKKLEIDVWPYLEELTSDVISRTTFGSSHQQFKRVLELEAEHVQLLVSQLLLFNYIPGWSYLPNKASRRLKAIDGDVESILKGIINQRERKMESGESVDDDLLRNLIESKKKTGWSIEDLTQECHLLYLAGSEATSSLLIWTLIMLSKYQEWQTRARQEVDNVFGNKQPTDLDGLNQLKTVTMILYEVLRMYPPQALTIREATKRVKVGSMMLPKGTHLNLLVGLLHHNPNIWGDDVNEFRPDRFSQGISNATQARYSFLPFSSGPRVCVAQNFAMIEAKLALTMMLQRFSFELSPSYRHAPFPVLALKPQYGAPLILHKL